jgi:alpha-L-fucosidase
MNDWGVITQKSEAGITKLYLHLFSIPVNRVLKVTGIKSAPAHAYMLDDKNKTQLTNQHNVIVTDIELPELISEKLVPVVVLEYPEMPGFLADLVARNIDGGYSFNAENIVFPEDQLSLVPKSRGGTIPSYLSVDSPTIFRWKFYIDSPGIKSIDVSYSYQGKSVDNHINIKVADSELHHEITNTGKTVGEPKSNWVIDNFRSTRLGSINFAVKGFYELEISISPVKKEEIKFQWLWLE